MNGVSHSDLKVEKKMREGILVLDIVGDLDSRNSIIAKDEIRAIIEQGHNQILINMDAVPFIDSAGLGTLVSALKAVRERSGTIYLAALADQVKMVIDLTRLDRVFTVFESVDAAMLRLNDPGFTDPSR